MKIPKDYKTDGWTKNPRSAPGKKLGTIKVELDRKVDRYHHATIKVDVRVDGAGSFYAHCHGQWFKCDTQAELREEIRQAFEASIAVTWTRYIEIRYSATAHEVGTRGLSSSREHLGLGDDRTVVLAAEDPEEHGRWARRAHQITGIDLGWAVVEYTEPYELPEEPGTFKRSRRDVDEDGDPRENDLEQVEVDLPRGLVPWTAERERVLDQILVALGQLDARLVALFAGAADELAGRLDGFSADRLLGSGGAP